MNRKYPKVVGYWVYSIYVPSINKYYIGVSKTHCHKRWRKSGYKSGSLAPYLEEWDSLFKTVIQDNLTKEEALKKEDELIQELAKDGLCINTNRSGLITSDANVYMRELRKTNTEYRERENQYHKQRYETDAEYREHKKQQRKQRDERNKEKINDNRRERYENDAEYRERTKQRANQYYEDNKEKINKKRRERRLKKRLEKQQNSPH